MRLRLPVLLLTFSSLVALHSQSPTLRSDDQKNKYLGNLNANRYDPNSVSNPAGRFGSPYNPDSINSPVGTYGSPYSPTSANNPYATNAPKIVTPDGKYLGRLSANPYDPDSTSNPYGKFGSIYSPDSINAPYGKYGSPYSPESVNNPYAIGAGPSLPVPAKRLPVFDSMGDSDGLLTTPNFQRRGTEQSLPRLPALPALPKLEP